MINVWEDSIEIENDRIADVNDDLNSIISSAALYLILYFADALRAKGRKPTALIRFKPREKLLMDNPNEISSNIGIGE